MHQINVTSAYLSKKSHSLGKDDSRVSLFWSVSLDYLISVALNLRSQSYKHFCILRISKNAITSYITHLYMMSGLAEYWVKSSFTIWIEHH